ncbi:MAG: SDR family oxidoreductase [Blastocatellia bacterium]|nr:SDR family oxidoreductase [Blastocatellia bacterium]
MRQLVTGGAGFIGSHLVEALLKEGHEVRVVDSLITGRRSNLDTFYKDIEFIEGDLANPEIARKAVQGVDCIFHEAAVPSVPRSVETPLLTQHNGEIALLNVLTEAVAAGVRRVVLAASSSAYGDTPTLPKVETMPSSPRSPYAASKLACEGYLSAFAHSYPIDTVSLRYFNVFGLRQDPGSPYSGVIAKFTTVMKKGERPVIYGDGKQTRDFCYIANAVQANLLAMRHHNPLKGGVFNIGYGRQTSLNELVRVLNRLFGTSLEPVYQPSRAGDVRDSLADISKAVGVLGYCPTHDLESGLREFLAQSE